MKQLAGRQRHGASEGPTPQATMDGSEVRWCAVEPRSSKVRAPSPLIFELLKRSPDSRLTQDEKNGNATVLNLSFLLELTHVTRLSLHIRICL